jgi:hypothetical protein
MKRLFTLLVISFTLGLNACATITPTQTVRLELLATPDFTVKRGEWFDSNSFDKAIKKKKANLNAPDQVLERFDIMLPRIKPMEFKMKYEIKRSQNAFISLGFYIKDSSTIISFQAGGLILTLKGPQGTIEVRDKGCLFVHFEDMKGTCHDSALGVVNFSRNFNDKPDYKVSPNVIWVRLDSQYNNWELIALTLDPQRIFIQSPGNN